VLLIDLEKDKAARGVIFGLLAEIGSAVAANSGGWFEWLPLQPCPLASPRC
jgi:hypothetical protein